MKVVLLTLGLTFLSLQTLSFKLGCSLPCGSNYAPVSTSWHHKGCGFDHEESMCSHYGRVSEGCVPLVVRPHEVPKPALAATAALSLAPVPGPCLFKKVIVKPAVLPKPVCRPTVESHHHGHFHDSHSSNMYGEGMDCRPVLHPGVPYGRSCAENEANCVPADAVSLALAYKMAHDRNCLSEDKLAFGFRKIPVELPPPALMRKNSIPEENIFALNGQIVELKPVAGGCRKSLDEEAADDLLALEEEEGADYATVDTPIRRVSLGELGYSPAKLTTPAFVDVTPLTTVMGHAVEHSYSNAEKCSCGSHTCQVIPGEVEYKTVPKAEQICLHPSPIPDSCESAEIDFDQHQEPGFVPFVTRKSHHHHCHKKSSVTIEKILA